MKDQPIRRKPRWPLVLGFLALAAAGVTFYVRSAPSRAELSCIELNKKMASALLLYASKNDDRLPDRDEWMTKIGATTYRCPELPKPDYPNGYSFNSDLS